MYLALFLFLLAVGAGVAHALLARTVTLSASVVGVLALLACSVGSFVLGRARMEEAIVNVNPEDREMLRAVGNKEAARNLQLGIPLALLALIPLGIGEIRRQKTSPPAAAP